MDDYRKGSIMLEMIGDDEEGMATGVALGIAIFLALSFGVYAGWTVGMKHLS